MSSLRMKLESNSRSEERRQQLRQELAAAVSRVDELHAARLHADEGAMPALAIQVQALLTDVLASLGELESAGAATREHELADGAEEAETWVGLRAGAPMPSRLPDVCFIAGFELSRALCRLAAASEPERVEIALESALRKLYRALRAVTESAPPLAFAATRGGQQLQLQLESELQAALSVRQLYLRFRQSLRWADGDERQDVLTALRYAAGALAALAASPHYTAIRASDRALLRQQRERLLDFARAGKPTNAGVQLLEDIFTCADLLRDINRRQELRAHDVALMRELVADPARERAPLLASLERLAGLDDTLDALAARLRASADLEPVSEIIGQLSLLLRQLGP